MRRAKDTAALCEPWLHDAVFATTVEGMPAAFVLVGFDVRIAAGTGAAVDSAFYRKSFLVEPTCEALMTVDAMIWPEALTSANGEPRWRGHFADLWDNLEAMESALREQPKRSGGEAEIAVAIHVDGLTVSQKRHLRPTLFGVSPDGTPSERLARTSPTGLDSRWTFEGLDVADLSLTSALTNCGLPATGAARRRFRATWGPHVNDRHLFRSLAYAHRFRVVSDRRVREHRPFFVFGLWSRAAPKAHR